MGVGRCFSNHAVRDLRPVCMGLSVTAGSLVAFWLGWQCMQEELNNEPQRSYGRCNPLFLSDKLGRGLLIVKKMLTVYRRSRRRNRAHMMVIVNG